MKYKVILQIASIIVLTLCSNEVKSQSFEVVTYPEISHDPRVCPKINYGDSFYVLLKYRQTEAKTARIPAPSQIPSGYINPEVKTFVEHGCSSRSLGVWHGAGEIKSTMLGFTISQLVKTYGCPQNTCAYLPIGPFQLPPLEDMHNPFWQKAIEEMNENPEGCLMEFNLKVSGSHSAGFQQIIRLMPRPEEEMNRIEAWYRDTPKKLLPKIIKECGCFIKITEDDRLDKKINGQSAYDFLLYPNRYPPISLMPETWEGWKELEDGFSQSTMKDDIRLTRMMVQYCVTKDKKVLDELKDWFTEMNMVQAVTMAKLIRRKALYCHDHEGEFRELYHAIRYFDISAKFDDEVEEMKTRKLLDDVNGR